MKITYELNKSSKVGTDCVCPSCGKNFTKASYQQAFCKTRGGTKCKDKYWNTVVPNKRNNKTRISPASKNWLINREMDNFNPDDHEHPFSSESLGQW
jgi:uncharacterized FlgJ-related protein